MVGRASQIFNVPGSSVYFRHAAMRITYSHTSIGTADDDFVAGFTADSYQKFMQTREKELNHFLTTGSRLGPDDTT